jgi:NAD(P)-dependent dehydrogenase (short-subunit alcohol dehydrogenase family)
MDERTRKTWFITGCSSGLGNALARAVLASGQRVVATARNSAALSEMARREPDACLRLDLDVNDSGALARAVREAEQRFGGIDVLVNNAGNLALGAVEECSDAEFRAMFEANFFRPFELVRLVLPGMRARRSGQIINISSVAALCPLAGAAAYSAAKAAMEAATDALAAEVKPFGVRAVSVVLGSFRTRVAESMTYAARKLPEYDATAHATQRYFVDVSGRQTGDPEKAAAAILDLARAHELPLRVPLGPASIDRVRPKLSALSREIESGAQLAYSVVYPEGS